jgi:dTDP-4-dehydrorhamnose 3,5-epimerase
MIRPTEGPDKRAGADGTLGDPMRFQETDLQGVFVVELEPHNDERGSFARAFCSSEFEQHGLDGHVEQVNLSTSVLAGTVRGLHYQLRPAAESKFVRCVRGALYDVAVDLRSESSTFGKWFGIELTDMNGTGLLVPSGFAHGFQTLADGTTALYLVSTAYDRQRERGLSHADPAVGIRWPRDVTTLSDRDRLLPRLDEAELP